MLAPGTVDRVSRRFPPGVEAMACPAALPLVLSAAGADPTVLASAAWSRRGGLQRAFARGVQISPPALSRSRRAERCPSQARKPRPGSYYENDCALVTLRRSNSRACLKRQLKIHDRCRGVSDI